MGIISDRLERERNNTVFSETPPFPELMMLDAANACNLKCAFCLENKSKRRNTLAKPEMVLKVLTEAHAGGTREVGFLMNGEPFLNPELENFVLMAKDIGYSYIYVTTNGILADKERLIRLVNSGLNSLKFSINAFDKESYCRIHGYDYFDRVMKNLYDAVNLRDESQVHGGQFYRVMVTSVYMESISDELLKFKATLEPMVDDFVLSKAHGTFAKKDFCVLPFNRLHVTSEGYLTACYEDINCNLVLADLNQIAIIEAWHGELARKLRRKHLNGDFDSLLCNHCLGLGEGTIYNLNEIS